MRLRRAIKLHVSVSNWQRKFPLVSALLALIQGTYRLLAGGGAMGSPGGLLLGVCGATHPAMPAA